MPQRDRVMQKLSILIIPYVICYLVSLSLSMALRWILEVKFSTNTIDAEFLDIWGPLLISFVIFWVVLKKRINIIKSKNLTPFFFIVFLSLSMMLPNGHMQDFVSSASFELINIDNADDIQQFKNEKFFKIGDYTVRPDLSSFYNDFKVTGKYSERLIIRVYAATPIVSNHANKIWHGVVFYKQISNSLNDTEKEMIFKKFYKETLTEFKDYDFKKVDYFKLLKRSYKTKGLLAAINQPNSNIFILEPVEGDFIERVGSSMFDNFFFVVLMFSIPLVFMIFTKVNQVELSNYLTPNISNNYINDLSMANLQRVGRNDLCPCGSGKKYKKCHLMRS